MGYGDCFALLGLVLLVTAVLVRGWKGAASGAGHISADRGLRIPKDLDMCIKAADATWADVVKTNTLVTDSDEFQNALTCASAISALPHRPAQPPASPDLSIPIFMLGIEAVAVVTP